MKYAIFSKSHDCEITVELLEGSRESMDAVREVIISILDNDPNQDNGYIEEYPFWRANWEITGGRLEPSFDCSQIIEVNWETTGETVKTFECFWGEGYRHDNRSNLEWHGADFFTEDRGYQPHDIEEILSLEIDGFINLSCVTGEHWVRRVS